MAPKKPHPLFLAGNFVKLAGPFSNEASKLLGCCNPDMSLDEFSEKLIFIAKNNIPKSKFSVRKNNTVWFNDTCKELLTKERKPYAK